MQNALRQLLRVMRITAFLLLVTCLHLSARTSSQTVTLRADNIALSDIFSAITAQTGYTVSYPTGLLKTGDVISLQADRMPLADFIRQLASMESFDFLIGDQTIFFSRKASEAKPGLNPLPSFPMSFPPGTVRGRVTDSLGHPLEGANVLVRASGQSVVTDKRGDFVLQGVPDPSVLLVSFIGYRSREITVTGDHPLSIILGIVPVQLDDVSVVSTGYQFIPKERATGSFVQVDNALFNRRVSTDVVSRLEGVVPGLLFNRNTVYGEAGQSEISIRGTSTLFANNQPLIVVDNFPYDGDISNINPNDVLNITVLKDAAASSIWGVRSGNGVIVITTKKGVRNQPATTEFNGNVTVGARPDLRYNPSFFPSGAFIDIEESLYTSGAYTSTLSSADKLPVTPVVQLLEDVRTGKLTADEGTARINTLRQLDSRDQLSQYFYRRSVNQQYGISVRGGSAASDYYFSMGTDQNQAYYTGNRNGRVTLNSNFNTQPFKHLLFSAGINYIRNRVQNKSPVADLSTGSLKLYPYAQFIDAGGNALAYAKDISSGYTSSTNPNFLDWTYRPYDELRLADNITRGADARINLGLQYQFLTDFTISAKYQYENSTADQLNTHSASSYFARNLVNKYTQVDQGGELTYPIPPGGILQQADNTLNAQRGRLQLNYGHDWNSRHALNIIAGAEISSAVGEEYSNTLYGYDQGTELTNGSIDFATNYALNPAHHGYVPTTLDRRKTTDHYLSYFTNGAYTLLHRYTFSASGRIDKSNLFGVQTNQKSVPLYSAGFSWDIAKEPFYALRAVPVLKLRATYGYNGNINKSATAMTTIRQFPAAYNHYPNGDLFGIIINPGNPDLRWEKIRMINVGADFGTRNNRLSGSLEYYVKRGFDLFGNSPMAPSSGVTSFFGNTADITGHGVDFVLNSRNIVSGSFSWTSSLLFTRVIDKVSKYAVETPVSTFVSANSSSTIYPLVGKPLYAVYSYAFAGLTHDSGMPQGLLDGKPSTDYAAILSSTTTSDMVLNGPARPTTYGSLRNTFTYRGFSVSVNLLYKLNYYFRKDPYRSASLPYTNYSEYVRRWQHPGDELRTTIPAQQYAPFDSNEEAFYSSSSAVVEKGDHVRLQDIGLNYAFHPGGHSLRAFKQLTLYSYVNNVGILWRANPDHLDPDLLPGSVLASFPLPRTFAIGCKATF
jgi:TonB-linked SusC/RagA family outer membrane protein